MPFTSGFSKEIYNVRGSGWRSSTWNWGYCVGTGHECALICRHKYSDINVRMKLIDLLWNPVDDATGKRDPNFEEVKLILGLTWQNARRDGSDGGAGGYGDVLKMMADAERYETDNEILNAKIFAKDLLSRIHLIYTIDMEKITNSLKEECGDDYDLLRRKLSSMVLSAMGFVEKGL